MKEREPSSYQAGVGLVEVLVALLVLSLGFLVSANMQLRGMRSTQDSFYESQALMLANEMMDRMRNNRPGVVGGKYNEMSTNGVVNKPACASSGCDADGLAELDRFEWSANLRDLRDDDSFVPMLPPAADGSPAVGTISAPLGNGAYSLTMTWKRQEGGSEVDEQLVVRFVP